VKTGASLIGGCKYLACRQRKYTSAGAGLLAGRRWNVGAGSPSYILLCIKKWLKWKLPQGRCNSHKKTQVTTEFRW